MAKTPSKPTKPRIVRKGATKSVRRAKHAVKQTTKQDQVLALLRRQSGASIDEIVDATGWQPHSARAFLTAAVKKHLGIDVVSHKGDDGMRRYHVAAIKS